MIKNLTLGTCSPRKSTSNSTYLDNGMAPPLALVKLNKWWASATNPSAGPSHGLKYQLKWSYHIKLTILLESSSEGTDSPITFSSILGHLATACFIILNWVSIDFTCNLVCGPNSFMSHPGKGCEPFTYSPLIGFCFNDIWCLMTPQSQCSAWLCICGLIYFGAAYNSLIHVWCLYNTSMLNCCSGTHLPLLMV